MAFDFKKEYRAFYMPKNRPELVTGPKMNYVAVRGTGDPNEAEGDYQRAVGILYAISYTLKMSGRQGHQMEGFFDYVVPPLEGFWQRRETDGIAISDKSGFHWISVIRLPDFVRREDFGWAVREAERKKKLDCSRAEFLSLDEGLCVQMLHCGPYDDEPATISKMEDYCAAGGYENDWESGRLHHEIYLSDPRRTDPAKWRTVIRHPVRAK